MHQFKICQPVAQQIPQMLVVVITAKGLAPNTKVESFANEVANSTLSTLTAFPNAQTPPRIALYREAVKKNYGLSPKKSPQSNESLCRRLLKEKEALPPINPIVDFYNSISIKHGVTAEAFDLDELKSKGDLPLELRTSAGSGTFLAPCTPDGEEATVIPRGELHTRKVAPSSRDIWHGGRPCKGL